MRHAYPRAFSLFRLGQSTSILMLAFPQASQQCEEMRLAHHHVIPCTRQEYQRDLAPRVTLLADQCAINSARGPEALPGPRAAKQVALVALHSRRPDES